MGRGGHLRHGCREHAPGIQPWAGGCMTWWRWLTRLRQGKPAAPLFSLGHVVITAAARAALGDARVLPDQMLKRHAAGDWGAVDDIDRKQNELGLKLGLRLRSIYAVTVAGHTETAFAQQGLKTPALPIEVWVITRPNRTRTTILLPREIFHDTSLEDTKE